MFVILCISLFFAGTILTMIDIMIPISWVPFVLMSLRICGIAVIGIGIFLLIIRIQQTGVQMFLQLPQPKRIILIHERRGGNAFFLPGRLIDLEHISSRGKLFKDTGGGFRVAGHDVRRTVETINHNVPEQIGQYITQLREKYMVDNLPELKTLYSKIKSIKTYEDLYHIKELKPVFREEDKRTVLMNMTLDDIRSMAEMLYDGSVVNMKDYERFIESAAPNDLDSFTTQQFAHRTWQYKTYTSLGDIDWSKLIIPISIMTIVAALAFTMISGG